MVKRIWAWSYWRSRLAWEHLIVFFAVIAWMVAAVWQLWVFEGRPEIWLGAGIMGFAAGTIGFYLAVVNRVDTDLRVVIKAEFDEGERDPGTGDPQDPQLGRVAAIIAGDDHAGWLNTSPEEREFYYRRAEAVISAVRQVTEDDK